MANKKKKTQKASVPSPKQKKAVKAPVIVAGAAALILAVAGIAGGTYFYSDWYQVHGQWEVNLSDASQAAGDIVMDLKDQIATNLGSAKVFDANGGVLFTLRSTSGLEVLEEVPIEILSKAQANLMAGMPIKPLNLDQYVAEQTKWGKLNGDETNSIVDSSLGYKVLQMYVEQESIMLSDEMMVITASYIDQQIEPTKLLNWVVCNGEFGSIKGLVNASESWFNKSVSQLNEWQIGYLAYAYQNPECSWDNFVETNPNLTGGAKTAEEFGFSSTGGDPYFSLKQEVTAELDELGYSLEEKNYNVQLSINPSLQSDLQKVVDDGLKAAVALDSVGNTSVDGSVMVVDSKTGMVTAYVGGRSVNTIAKQFALAGDSPLGTLKVAEEMFAEDPTLSTVSLMEYDLASGEPAWDAFGDLVLSQQLGVLGKTADGSSQTTVEDVADFLTGLMVSTSDSTDNHVRYIKEIQLSRCGKTTYLAEEAKPVYTRSPELDTLGLLLHVPEDTAAPFAMQTDNGIVWAETTTEYVVVGMFGSNSMGYSLSAEDYDACITTATINLPPVVYKHYPKTPQKFDVDGTLANKMAAAREKNKDIVIALAEEYVEDLKTHVINSVGTRASWEEKYFNYTNSIAGYAWTISEELADKLLAGLDAVRSSRSSELLKFVA